MENFPQTYEPTGSQSILEQFVGLKNFMNNKLNSNEYVKTTKQTLTEEQKAQARENIGAGASTINVIDNLTSQSNIDALSANQGRVLNEKINSSVQTLNQSISQNVNELQQDIDANGGDIASLQGDVSELNQEISKTLKTPMSAPSTTELVGVDNTNSQVMLEIGNGINIVNGVINIDRNIIQLYYRPPTDATYSANTIHFPALSIKGIVGNRLNLSNNGVLIGNDVNKVKISGFLSYWADGAGKTSLLLNKNGTTENTFENYITSQKSVISSFSDYIINVSSGDLIQLGFTCDQVGHMWAGATKLYLTVEVIE